MIQIDNKFDVGQEVYLIELRSRMYGDKQKFKWVVKNKKSKPVKIVSLFYKKKILDDEELSYCVEKLLYHVENYEDDVPERHLFTDYETALQECNRRNEEEKNAGFAVE